MNINSTLLRGVVLFFLFFTFSFTGNACINSVSIETMSTTDHGDGTCTYDIEVTINHTNVAVLLDLTALGGSFNSCDGGSCEDIPAEIDGSTIVSASITKNCADEITIFARGKNAGGFGCGAQGTRFTGMDSSLPVELASFEAKQESRINQLIWNTSSEENTLAFLVQRSINGVDDFETIGRVNAVGYSTSLQTYDFVDDKPVSLAYYRLQMVDRDGSFEFSNVLVVERLKTEIDVLEVYPVPVVDSEVNILIHSSDEGPVFVDLFDMTGRVIKQDRLILEQGINKINLDWESNEGNFYFFTIYNGKERISKKILLSNLD